jgi:hypothetical protein
VFTPPSGSYQWWSGSGNSLSNTLTRDVDLTGKTSASLSLKTGPYNFGFLDAEENWVEHFPYQNGLLIWLRDTSQGDNNAPTPARASSSRSTPTPSP